MIQKSVINPDYSFLLPSCSISLLNEIQCSHPTLWKFIDKLIFEEDSNIHTKIVRANAGELPSKKKKYQYLDKRLLNLVSNPHRNIIDQITALAHNITLN